MGQGGGGMGELVLEPHMERNGTAVQSSVHPPTHTHTHTSFAKV